MAVTHGIWLNSCIIIKLLFNSSVNFIEIELKNEWTDQTFMDVRYPW